MAGPSSREERGLREGEGEASMKRDDSLWPWFDFDLGLRGEEEEGRRDIVGWEEDFQEEASFSTKRPTPLAKMNKISNRQTKSSTPNATVSAIVSPFSSTPIVQITLSNVKQIATKAATNWIR